MLEASAEGVGLVRKEGEGTATANEWIFFAQIAGNPFMYNRDSGNISGATSGDPEKERARPMKVRSTNPLSSLGSERAHA